MRRISLVAAGVLLLVLVLLAVAQLVLPGIAAERIRGRLAHRGTVLSVNVSAFPAVELLWHHADRVVVRMGTYASSQGQLSNTLGGIGDAASLDASAQRLVAGLLTLRNASLRKRGDQLVGRATVTQADLRTALPVIDGVQLVSSANGELTLQGTASVFGLTTTADATVRPQNGNLIVSPDVPFGGLATVTAFSSPTIAVDGISATQTSSGFTVTAQARVR
jgi:hypothetical protein